MSTPAQFNLKVVEQHDKAPRPSKPSNQRAVYDAIHAGGKSVSQIRKLLRATDDAERVKGMTVKQTQKAIDNLIYRGAVMRVNGKLIIASLNHFTEKNTVSLPTPQPTSQPAPQPAPQENAGYDLTINKSFLTHALTAALAGAAGVAAGLVL